MNGKVRKFIDGIGISKVNILSKKERHKSLLSNDFVKEALYVAYQEGRSDVLMSKAYVSKNDVVGRIQNILL